MRYASVILLSAGLLAGCETPTGETATTQPNGGEVVVPESLYVADALVFGSPGRSLDERLRRRLGDDEAAGVLRRSVNGSGRPVRTLLTSVTLSPRLEAVAGRFRLLVPAASQATVTIRVGDQAIWTRISEDERHVLSPWIELPEGPPAGPLTIRVEGDGGVTDLLICRSREAVATQPTTQGVEP